MTISMQELAAFCAVYEAGGVNAAARRLSLSRSVVSKRIADLEAHLGVDLFVRSTKQMATTDAADVFYARAASLVGALDEAVNEVREAGTGLTGALRIAAPVDAAQAFLNRPIFQFATLHPDIRIALDLDDRMVDLSSGAYDVAVRIGRLPDSALKAKKLCESRRILCASPAYLAQHGAPTSIDDLPHHDVIGYSNAPISQIWRFAAEGGVRSVRVRCRAFANSGSAMVEAATAGLGLLVLPAFIVQPPIDEGRLVAVTLPETPVPDGVYAVYPPMRNSSAKVRAFIDHLTEALSGRPPWERS